MLTLLDSTLDRACLDADEQIRADCLKLNTPRRPVVLLNHRTQNQGLQDHQALDRNKEASARGLRQGICTPDRYFNTAKRQVSTHEWTFRTPYSTIIPDLGSRMVLFAPKLD
jgi:hypothetical protein